MTEKKPKTACAHGNHGPIEVIYGIVRPKVKWCLTCGAIKHSGGEWQLPLIAQTKEKDRG